MYRNILVPLDGSQRAEAILPHVQHIARQNNARVILLKVEDEPIMLHRDEVIDIGNYHDKFELQKTQSLAYLSHMQNRLGAHDILSDIRLAYGAVVKAILRTAEEAGASLIAMATHGWGGLSRVSYGSVAAGVLQAAEVPILLIRSGDESESSVSA